jgi:hypothetical protein
MKKEKPRKRGIQNREPDANAIDAKMINPAVTPLDPEVLNTGTATDEAAAEYVAASEPLEEKPKGDTSTVSSGAEEKRGEQTTERKSGAAEEFYSPNTPLEEKPLSGSATRRRMKATAHRRNSAPSRKSIKRASR